jgi:DNA-binding transcriptional LysR family regulator
MRLHMNFNRMAYFAAVVDTGSFTAAADKLGITKAVVSQQVAKLEEEAGTALLVRNTRRIYLTDAGRAFHSRCSSILRDVEFAFDELAEGAEMPMGLLRIIAPVAYGHCLIVPAVAKFTELYPTCRAAVTLSDKGHDLIAEQIDIAIRIGDLADSSYLTRRIGSIHRYLVCSPVFAARVAEILQPEDLGILPFVANTALEEPYVWELTHQNGDVKTLHASAAIMVDAMPAAYGAALAGGGLAILPEYLVSEDILQGRLLRILPEWSVPTAGIHAIYPATRYRATKVRAFIDLLIKMQSEHGIRTGA